MPTEFYRNFTGLAAHEPSTDYGIIACPRPSPVAVIALHGSEEREDVVHVGGGDAQLAESLSNALVAADFAAQQDNTADHPGRLLVNICNRGQSSRGCQLEISQALRRTLFAGLNRTQHQHTAVRFDQFVNTVRSVLLKEA